MQIYLAQMEVKLAINTGLQVLEMLGVSLKQDPPKDLAIEELANLPIMSDPHKLTAMRILVSIIAAAYSGDPALLSHLTYTMVDLSIKYGNSPQAAYAYCLYGMILSGVMGEIDSGYQFGKLALKVLEICRATELKSKVLCIFNGCIRHWKESAQETLEFLLEGIQSGLETGDIEHAGYCSHHYCSHTLFVGKPLELVTERYSQYVELMIKLKHNFSANYLNVIYQLSLNLMGRSIDLFSLNGEALNEAEAVPVLIEKNNAATLSQFYLAKTILFYFFKKPQMALENAKNAEKYAGAGIGLILQAEQNFYYSLALLSLCLNAEREEKIKYLSQVKANQARMKLWAYNIPQNFKHKYELVEAETARVLGKIGKAMEYYERAIAGAKEQGYIHEEALANELAAEFYFSRNQEKIATVFITEAYYGYARWGATAKVKDLEESYHEIFSKILKREPEEIEVGRTTTATTYFNSGVLDLATVMKAYQALSSEIVLGKLLEKVIQFVLENAGAQTSYLILETEGKLLIEAMGSVDQKEVTVLKSIPITTSQHLPLSVINYVARTKENIVFKNATCEGLFTSDPYITQFQPQSILCMPILHQGKLIGILYLENNLTTSAFTPERIEVLKILASQAAISIENARLYTKVSQAKEELENYNRTLEHKVEERTLELKGKNARLIQEISDRKRTEEALRQSEALLRIKAEQLELALKELQAAQTQLIQNEKMSSLGQLVAGVAHEINNPVNFIYGNLTHADEYTSDLFQLLNLYQQHYPNPGSYIHDFIEEIELEFVREDLPKLLSSMKLGADRIRQIVLSLRNFSRLDEAEMKPVDIHEGIDSTLMILQNRLKAKPDQPAIQLIKEYGNLPLVECYAGSLNQVFMNLLSNAIDVLEETIKSSLMDSSTCQVDSSKIVGNGEGTGSLLRTHDLQPTIRIRTEMVDKDRVLIRIADNGHGMTEEIRHRLFDPFYTTKPVGKGTGLGLSISYQIVVEKHGGRLHCISAPCQGAEFTIEIPIRQQY